METGSSSGPVHSFQLVHRRYQLPLLRDLAFSGTMPLCNIPAVFQKSIEKLCELLGNLVTRASEIWRDTAFFQGASMTPILLAFRLYSYFYYFWIF